MNNNKIPSKFPGLILGVLIVALSNPLSAQYFSIQLNEPLNTDTIYNLRPSFTWNAMGMNDRTSFVIKVCKVGPEQSPAEAINQNIPIIQAGPTSSNTLMYPSALDELDSSSTYSWQVTFFNDQIPVALSEVFVFYTPASSRYKGLFWILSQHRNNQIFRYPVLAVQYNNKYSLKEMIVTIRKKSPAGELAFQGPVLLYKGSNTINLNRIEDFPILPVGNYYVNVKTRVGEDFSFIYQKY